MVNGYKHRQNFRNMCFSLHLLEEDMQGFCLEEKNMLSWLKGMDKHDFTGKRAKEQWEAQELVRKRKKEQFQNGQAKIPKQDDESLEKPLETNED